MVSPDVSLVCPPCYRSPSMGGNNGEFVGQRFELISTSADAVAHEVVQQQERRDRPAELTAARSQQSHRRASVPRQVLVRMTSCWVARVIAT